MWSQHEGSLNLPLGIVGEAMEMSVMTFREVITWYVSGFTWLLLSYDVILFHDVIFWGIMQNQSFLVDVVHRRFCSMLQEESEFIARCFLWEKKLTADWCGMGGS